MSRTYHHGKNNPYIVRARAILRKEVDHKKLARALIFLSEAQLEKEAEMEHKRRLRNGQKEDKKKQ